MSFGVVQSAISSLKSNRKLLSKRDKLKNTLSVEFSEEIKFGSNSATPADIKRIRNRMKEENRRIRTKQILVLNPLCIMI